MIGTDRFYSFSPYDLVTYYMRILISTHAHLSLDFFIYFYNILNIFSFVFDNFRPLLKYRLPTRHSYTEGDTR